MALELAPSLHPPPGTETAPEPDGRRERMRRLAWLGSMVLHAIVLALLLGLWKSPHVDDLPVIQVALVPGMGDAGKAGGSGGGAAKEGQLAQGSEAPTPNNAADATPPESTTTETVDTQPVPPTPEPQTTQTPPAPPTPPTVTTVTDNPPAPVSEKPVVRLPPPPPRKPAPPQPTAVAAAPPPPQPAPPTPQPSPSPAPLPQVATAPVPSATPGTPGTGTGRGGPGGVGQGETGSGHGIVGNGNGPGDDYLERVRRWIEKYKTYPDVAKKQKQQGVPLLSIHLRRDGTVLDVHIEKSSGFPLLDDAAVKAVHDASPVPPFPPSYEEQEIEYGQPFAFHLGFFDRVLD